MALMAAVIEQAGRQVVINLQGVGRTFGTGSGPVVALQHLDLTVEAGDWLAITGPSGSGKSTLINLIAGLDRATEGTVRVLDNDLNSLSETNLTSFRARNLGLVFQDPHLLPGLTATENVVAARLPWSPSKGLETKARDLLGEVGLGHRMDFPPNRLSGGERQRVGIARALLGEPRLILADEPTGNLDRESTATLMDLFATLQTSLGLTVVIATHDPLVAAAATHRLALRDGRVEVPQAAAPVGGLTS